MSSQLDAQAAAFVAECRQLGTSEAVIETAEKQGYDTGLRVAHPFIAGASFPTYRFLQRIYHTRGMALFAASRDAFSLGTLARLFWNPANALHIPPFHEHDAEQLFEAAADHFKLRNLDLDEFREKVLDSARGNPGQIIEMCRLATQAQYHAGRYIKFAPLRIDTVMKFG